MSQQTTPEAPGPLAGLKVIEISSFVAAPLGGMTLAQLGADVIRVDPSGGAADRYRWPLSASGTSMYWAGLNKGKRSITVDFRSEEGRNVIRDLVGACEPGTAVVLTNAVGRGFLSCEYLREVCDDLIHVQVQGKADGSPAVDYTVNAEVGFPLITGPQGHNGPVNHVLPAWDIACGLYAALAVSAAERQRSRTGRGDEIQIALEDVALAMAGNLGFLTEAQMNGVSREKIGNDLYGSFARDFACSDGGRLMVVALTSRHWIDLLKVTEMTGPVGALEHSLGVDFTREDDRYEYREALAGLFHHWFKARTTREAKTALGTSSLLWAPYRSLTETVTTLKQGSNSLMTIVDQPGVGPHLAPGSPMRFTSKDAPAVPAPSVGADSEAILAEVLGLDATTRERLIADRVVGA